MPDETPEEELARLIAEQERDDNDHQPPESIAYVRMQDWYTEGAIARTPRRRQLQPWDLREDPNHGRTYGRGPGRGSGKRGKQYGCLKHGFEFWVARPSRNRCKKCEKEAQARYTERQKEE